MAKLRKVGNSVGVIIPKKIIEGSGLNTGDTIQVSLPVLDIHSANEKLLSIAGKFAGKSGFTREKGDRF